MIEEGAPAVEEAAANTVSAGEILKHAREATGLHVAALAVSLKVPVRKLEALEDNRWEQVGDVVFIRALASSVCRTLKIDAQPVLERLPQTGTPRLLQDGEGINTPFRSPSDGPNPTILDQLSRPVALAVIAILLAAVVVVMLPSRPKDSLEVAAVPAETAAASAMAMPSPMRPAEPVRAASDAAPALPAAAPAPSSPVSSSLSLAQSLSAPSPSTASPSAQSPATPSPSAQSPASSVVAPAAEPAPAAAASGAVVFSTRGASWIEVLDAKGVVVLRKIMEPGESAGANGAMPLQVTVGRSDLTEVQVRGKPFNLAPVSKDNVARFQVK